MGSQGVMSHQLLRDLLRQRRVEAALFVDRRQFRNLACGICREFSFFEAEVGLFGIRLPENFNHPYLRPNLTQFWNNWHMTLTQWFRGYFFNPFTRALRQAKRPLPIWAVILLTQLATMILIGLWHGISWGFLAWGAWHGLGLFVQNRWTEWIRPLLAGVNEHPAASKVLMVLSTLFTFIGVTLGWVWFALSTPALSWQVILRLFGLDQYNLIGEKKKDGRVDVAVPGIMDRGAGLLMIPWYRPFDPDSAFIASFLEPSDSLEAAFSALGQNGARHRIEHLIFPTPTARENAREKK